MTVLITDKIGSVLSFRDLEIRGKIETFFSIYSSESIRILSRMICDKVTLKLPFPSRSSILSSGEHVYYLCGSPFTKNWNRMYCDGKSTKIPKRDFIFARVKTGQVGT